MPVMSELPSQLAPTPPPAATRRQVLLWRAHRLGAILLAVGGLLAVGATVLNDATSPPPPVDSTVERWLRVMCPIVISLWLLLRAHTAGAFRSPPAVPGPAPEDWRQERLPTGAEWTLLVARALGYGSFLAFMVWEALRSLRVPLQAVTPRQGTLLSPERTLQLNLIGLVAALQLAYYLAPRDPLDRRARVLRRDDGSRDREPLGAIALALLGLGVLLFGG